MNNEHQTLVEEAVKIAGVRDFSGSYSVLGHGEHNESFLLQCDSGALVLRVAKNQDTTTLAREAHALSRLNNDWAPKLVFFNPESRLQGRRFIVESHIHGKSVDRLSPEQFYDLGVVLAQVHRNSNEEVVGDVWSQLLTECSSFGDDTYLLSHPNERLRSLLADAKRRFVEHTLEYKDVHRSLIHSDATPSNILVTDSGVALIDWELSQYKDPMAEFSTVYYEDMEYNRGKWRIQITQTEKEQLFSGYEAGGGTIDEDRIRFWISFDKLGAAVFLWWRIHESAHPAPPEDMEQYALDLEALLCSLEGKHN